MQPYCVIQYLCTQFQLLGSLHFHHYILSRSKRSYTFRHLLYCTSNMSNRYLYDHNRLELYGYLQQI